MNHFYIVIRKWSHDPVWKMVGILLEERRLAENQVEIFKAEKLDCEYDILEGRSITPQIEEGF